MTMVYPDSIGLGRNHGKSVPRYAALGRPIQLLSLHKYEFPDTFLTQSRRDAKSEERERLSVSASLRLCVEILQVRYPAISDSLW